MIILTRYNNYVMEMVMMFQVCDFLHRFNVEYGDTFSGFEAGDI